MNSEELLKKIEELSKKEQNNNDNGLSMSKINGSYYHKEESGCQFCEICNSKIERGSQSTIKGKIENKEQQIIIKNENKLLNEAEKKKLKKKQYKKRQQMKQHLRKEKVYGQLRLTIHQIFGLKTDFFKQKHVILQCLEIFHDEIQFRSFMHNALEAELELIRKQLLGLILPIQLNSMPSVSIIPKIFQQFERVRQAVPEIQKIINLFLNYNHHISKYHANLFIDLNHLIFKLLLSDDHKKKLIHLCDTLLTLDNINLIQHERQKIMIKDILTLTQQQNQQNQQSEQSYDMSSQINSQEPQSINEIETQKMNRQKSLRKGKKKRNYELISTYQNISNILQNFVVDENRLPCNVNQEWILKLDHQISKLLKKYK